ncbi:MAG: glycine cleavage system protein GcvH [Clostridiales bacterium]|nr:glycine cleavage system protein GcvH [Clostridiales bacterium]
MNLVPGLLYSKEHEWVKVEGNDAYVGITNYAQLQLGDIVYVEIPEVDDNIKKGEVLCTVESVKTAADVFSPLSGIITKVNEELDDEPEKVNEQPYEAWLAVITMSDLTQLDELLDEKAYAKYCEEEE